MFVILNTETGQFVARSGSSRSYTDKLQDAQVFTSRDQAEKYRCSQGEDVVSVAEVLGVSQ